MGWVCSSCTIASFAGGWPDPSRGLCQHCILPFTQLIQQPGVEQSIASYPSARGTEHRDRDRHRVARLGWQCTTEIYRPRTCSIIQPARLYVIIIKTLGGFATSLSLFFADHHLSGAVFLSLFTNHDANPTCMEEARCCILGLGLPLELSSKPNHMLSQDPVPRRSRFYEIIMSLGVALEREMSSHIRPDQLSDLPSRCDTCSGTKL
jgi:hypothetical protein